MGARFEVPDSFLFVGRTFEEYCRMFGLDPVDLSGTSVLDCPGGPGSDRAGGPVRRSDSHRFLGRTGLITSRVSAGSSMYERYMPRRYRDCRSHQLRGTIRPARRAPVSDCRSVPVRVVEPASVARVLRNPIRRATLAVVLDRDGSVPVADLVATVHDEGEAYGVDPDDDHRTIRRALHHRHLSFLVGSGFLERLAGGNEVEPGDHHLLGQPIVDAAWLRRDGANWDALGAVFGQPRRQVAVAILAGADLPLPLAVLARAVAAERIGDIALDSSAIQDFQTRLHHVGLPMLDAAGVVSYDGAAGLITAVDTPDLPLPVDGV